jgi:phosphonate transport system permease protein
MPRWLQKKYLLGLIIVGVLVWATVYIQASPGDLYHGLPNIWHFLRSMFPPDFKYMSTLGEPVVVTIGMAAVGTAYGAIIAIPLGILAAGNVVKIPFLTNIFRAIIEAARVIPDFVIALVFIAAIGLGPFAGVMALTIHSVGFLGKMYREAIEEMDPGSLEGVTAVGAGTLQKMRFAVLPAILPNFTAHTLYMFDINVRSSIILGFVGAGGLGLYLMLASRLFKYDQVLAVVIIIFVLIFVTEKLSDKLREKIIGKPTLQ